MKENVQILWAPLLIKGGGGPDMVGERGGGGRGGARTNLAVY